MYKSADIWRRTSLGISKCVITVPNALVTWLPESRKSKKLENAISVTCRLSHSFILLLLVCKKRLTQHTSEARALNWILGKAREPHARGGPAHGHTLSYSQRPRSFWSTARGHKQKKFKSKFIYLSCLCPASLTTKFNVLKVACCLKWKSFTKVVFPQVIFT